MDISTITQIISTVGFPIAACVALFIQMNKQGEQHKQEMDALKDALNQNTNAITELTVYLHKEENK